MPGLADLTPNLAALSAKLEGDMITWHCPGPDAVIRFPLPPWSTPADVDRTSGVIPPPDIHERIPYINWHDGLQPQYPDFRLYPRGDDPNAYHRIYEVYVRAPVDPGIFDADREPDPLLTSRNSRRQWLSRSATRTLRIDLHPGTSSPTLAPRITVTCSILRAQTLAVLILEQRTDRFDADDPGAWPVSRDTLIEWAHHIDRLDFATGD